ncbi:hypothetical protein [Pseudonocardia parietis]|uniref:Tetratricopeptide (TPR) repeat protein n=1 Tax=Pseudonocardia parietis TaxID=570936 RepID=A0ABS4VUG0_9PSEU|nr:hypothetical protein [Pseudonocardia parietis]MBP2367358.1 tetratricopeptide (TPR) repeat protein [Pseudonocardia parietis]
MRPRRDEHPSDDRTGATSDRAGDGLQEATRPADDTSSVSPQTPQQDSGEQRDIARSSERGDRPARAERYDDRPRRRPDPRDDRRARNPREDRRRDDRPGRRDERGGGRPRRVPEAAERTMVVAPDLPDSISASDLDASVRRDLRGLQKETAEVVARHLVAAGVLVDENPELALEHVRYARRRASRIAVVREAAGIVAYHAGEWNEALGEFRAARRMGGGPGHVHVMADIERALGRPERALDLARSPEARDLGTEERIELLIVEAGARRDLGEQDAAVVGLQVPELDGARRDPWSARLFYAYADNLLAAGRESEAVQWFVHAHDADSDGRTDAADRIAELTGDELPGGEDDGMSIGYEDVPADEMYQAADTDDAADDVADGDVADGGDGGYGDAAAEADEASSEERASEETASGQTAFDEVGTDEAGIDADASDEAGTDETPHDEDSDTPGPAGPTAAASTDSSSPDPSPTESSSNSGEAADGSGTERG